MNKKNIIWGVFIVILILIFFLVFTLLGNDEKIDQSSIDEGSNNAQTLYEDDYTVEDIDGITPDTTSTSKTSTSVEQNNYEGNNTAEGESDLIANQTNNITTEDSTDLKNNEKKSNEEIEEKEISLKMYITSNIRGDFTSYDYDYDKKDYDGSFSQLAKIINDKVKDEDYLLNLGETFSNGQNDKTVDSFIESFNHLKYDLWFLSVSDYEKLNEKNIDNSKFLTPNSSKIVNSIAFYNNSTLKNDLENELQIALNKEEKQNRITISNKYNDYSKEFIINDSTESLYQIDYMVTKQGSEFTNNSTLTKIPVKNEDRVILPLHSIEKIFKEYHQESIEELKTIIAEVVNGDLFEKKNLDQIDSYHLKPTKLTDLINEVQLYYANEMSDSEIKISSTPIYVENLELSNQISKRYINRFYPEKNNLYIVELTGKQLKEYLEWSVEFYNKFEENHLTITRTNKSHTLYDIFKGINYEINISKNFGDRIENLTDSASNTIEDGENYLLVTNSDRVENEFSNLGEIFSEELPKIINNSKDNNKYSDYLMSDFIEEYLIKHENGIIKSENDQNWKITGNNWNKIHRIKAEKIFQEGNLTINNKVPLNYKDIKELAEKITLKYTVESGDWLLKISRIYGVSYKEIAEKNDIDNPDLIYPNQVFVIPEE